jgi:hypothetical protein
MYIEKKNVQFIGLNELDPDDQEKIKEVIFNKYPFIEREIKRINFIKVHFKIYKADGRKKYSIHMLIDSPNGIIVSDHVYEPAEWDPLAGVHMLIEKARTQIRHKFKKTDRNP